MDRLIEAIDNTQNPSVVGLDPTEALVPPQVVASFADEVRDSVESPEEVESAQLAVAYFEYNRTIIDAIADIVPAVKPQIAMYEALGPAGVDIYTMTCEYAAQQGLYVLGDIKRGDILAVPVTGAYGRTMASNYNQALIPAVVGVGEAGAHVMIRRQTIDDLLSWDVSE